MISDKLKKRYNAFWDHEAADGCLMYVEADGENMLDANSQMLDGGEEQFASMTEEEREAAKLKRNWTDVDYRVKLEKLRTSTTKYYGDAFPSVFTNFGPGSLSACIGGGFDLAPHTIWFDCNPIITDWENLPKIELDRNSEMWKLMDRFTRGLCENSNGGYHTSIADIGGTLDIIASLRGSQTLLYDMYDYHDEVQALIEKIKPMWIDTYNHLADIIFAHNDGMTSWQPLWCKDRYYPLQCDFSAMISPDMFDDLVLPDLKWQTEFLDHSIYHLDGPGELPHLDSILSLPRLDAIQWVPGAGLPDVMDEDWFEMYDKIQAAGKNLVLFVGEPDSDKTERCLNRLKSTKGVFVFVRAQDCKQAEELVAIAEAVGVK